MERYLHASRGHSHNSTRMFSTYGNFTTKEKTLTIAKYNRDSLHECSFLKKHSGSCFNDKDEFHADLKTKSKQQQTCFPLNWEFKPQTTSVSEETSEISLNSQ